MTKTFKDVQEAMSSVNGIIFYSDQYDLPFGVETFIDEKGRMRSKLYLVSNYNVLRNMESRWFYESDDIAKVNPIFLLIIRLLLIIIAVFSKNFNITFAILYFSVMALHELVLVIFQCKYIKQNEKGKRLGRFHAAEHKSLNAYRKYERVPTCDEIKAESKISRSCGSRFIIRKIATVTAVSFIIAVAVNKSLVLYVVSIIILIVLFILENKVNYLRIFQYMFVNEPTDEEIEVARNCLIMYEKVNNNMEEMRGTIEETLMYLTMRSALYETAVVIEMDCYNEKN
jgi:hypothetical protein